MARVRGTWLIYAAALWLLTVSGLAAQNGSPDAKMIAQRVSEQQRAELARQHPYELTRSYDIFHRDGGEASGHVVAKIQYEPPGKKTYEIEQSSGGMGERTIRHVLEHEVNLTREPQKVAMTDDNYNFSLVGEESVGGRRCFVMQVEPKREDRDLLTAKVWVDAGSYRIVRLQGRPERSPSFWVKDLNLTISYGDVGGLWMRTGSEAVAELRVGGAYIVRSHNLSMRPLDSGLAQPQGRTAAMMAGAVMRAR